MSPDRLSRKAFTDHFRPRRPGNGLAAFSFFFACLCCVWLGACTVVVSPATPGSENPASTLAREAPRPSASSVLADTDPVSESAPESSSESLSGQHDHEAMQHHAPATDRDPAQDQSHHSHHGGASHAGPEEHASETPPSPPIGEDLVAPAYTCPMHSEVESHEPGKCPQCGMDLVLEPEPEDPGQSLEVLR